MPYRSLNAHASVLVRDEGGSGESSEMINEARAIATKRMVEEATELGAEAVIDLRYATSTVMQGAAEVLAYGTAVKFK